MSFAEIYNSATQQEQAHLKLRIITDLGCTNRTINNWINGSHRPMSLSQMNDLAKAVNRVLGIKATATSLFPSNS